MEEKKDVYQSPEGAPYLLAGRRWSKDTVGQTFSILLFQQSRTLHSASLVHSPQNQDTMLGKDNSSFITLCTPMRIQTPSTQCT